MNDVVFRLFFSGKCLPTHRLCETIRVIQSIYIWFSFASDNRNFNVPLPGSNFGLTGVRPMRRRPRAPEGLKAVMCAGFRRERTEMSVTVFQTCRTTCKRLYERQQSLG